MQPKPYQELPTQKGARLAAGETYQHASILDNSTERPILAKNLRTLFPHTLDQR